MATEAAKNLTPCILELGGKCPAIISEDADIGHAADKIAWAKFSNSGQTCIAPDYLLVNKKISAQFMAALKQSIRRMWGDLPNTSEEMGKIINDFHWERLTKLMQTSGGEIVYGGKTNKAERHIEPTIITNPKPDSGIMNEEIFGPILPFLEYDTTSEAIDFINDKPKPLAVYYYGVPNTSDANRVLDETSSGAFAVNESITQSLSHYTGFGGVGESGSGRYGGYEGYKSFSNAKGCIKKYPLGASLRAPLLPPFTDKKIQLLTKFLPYALMFTQSQVRWLMRILSLLFVTLLLWWYIY